MSKKKPRTVRLHLTDQAVSDLVAIEAFSVEQWGRRVANKYLAEIEARLTLIQESPGILSNVDGIPTALQCCPAGSHVLIFDVRPSSLVLLTVIHGSRDLPNRLAELAPTLAAEVALLHRKLK